jgi:hypothetical protein
MAWVLCPYPYHKPTRQHLLRTLGEIQLDAQGFLLAITSNLHCAFAALVQAISAALSTDGLSLDWCEI